MPQDQHDMQGIIAAVPTPIDDRLTPQKDPFLDHCQWLLENGCDGLNILGSTGEANSISNSYRQQIMGWAADGLDTQRLMVGTGTPSLQETIELTVLADELGYSIALVLPPYYYKPLGDKELLSWFVAIDKALSGRSIEIYFYNFPQMTGLTIPVSVIEVLTTRFPTRFTGIKDSSGDLDYCCNILSQCPNLNVFPSSETSLDQAHRAGFAGCISATVNITSQQCAEVWQARENPPTDTLSGIASQRNAIATAGLIPAIKFLVGHRTQLEIWKNPMPPFLPLAETTGQRLLSDIQF